MRSSTIGTAQLVHVQVEAEEGVHQGCLLLLGEVLWQGGVEAGGEDGLQLVHQILLDRRSGAFCHPDEEEGVVLLPDEECHYLLPDEEEGIVASPVLLAVAKDATRSPNHTFKLLSIPGRKFLGTNEERLSNIFSGQSLFVAVTECTHALRRPC